MEIVKGLDWAEGDKLKKDTGHRRHHGDWVGKVLAWLHNLATDVTDHITNKLDQSTITQFRKIRRVARGTWLESGRLMLRMMKILN